MEQWCRFAVFGKETHEERGSWDMLCCVVGNLWRLQDGRAEVDLDHAALGDNIPMVNPEVDAEPIVTKTRIEEHGRRIHISMKAVSEFRETLGCKACLLVGQPHTEDCRARITARVESDLELAKRLQDNLTRRVAFSKPESEVAQNESRTDPSKRARQDEGSPEESAIIGGASSSTAQSDVEVQMLLANYRRSQAAMIT